MGLGFFENDNYSLGRGKFKVWMNVISTNVFVSKKVSDNKESARLFIPSDVLRKTTSRFTISNEQ